MTETAGGDQAANLEGVFSAERAKAFIDAVVAIAMTLLILPLMDSVADVAARNEGTAHWVGQHQWQVISFVLSFAVIARFWIHHHRMFASVHRVSSGFLWVSMGWLVTIVWLPVATALTGQMRDDDTVAKSIYIGTMIATCVLTLLQRLYLLAHRELHTMSEASLRRGLAENVAMITLFAAALAVAVAVPAIGYFALLVMFAAGPTQRLAVRVMGPRRTVRRR